MPAALPALGGILAGFGAVSFGFTTTMVGTALVGAIAGGAEGDELLAIRKYGELSGLAFQIADDILDVEGTTEEIGKDAGSDQERGKATYPSVMGLDASKKELKIKMDEAISTISIFGERAEPLRQIAKYIVERKN